MLPFGGDFDVEQEDTQKSEQGLQTQEEERAEKS